MHIFHSTIPNEQISQRRRRHWRSKKNCAELSKTLFSYKALFPFSTSSKILYIILFCSI